MQSPFDSRNIIWYISEVTPQDIRIHFPDSKILKRFNNNWDSLHWWILGSFVAIEWETQWFIWKIVKLSLPEKERMSLSESSYKNKELHPVWIVEILFSFDLLSFEARKSIQDYPPISSKVYVCSPELYIDILKKNKNWEYNDELEIWEALWTNTKVNLSANHIFNRHCAILWTTGWWKSYTISKIIQELVEKDDAKIILLDATWEFSDFDNQDYSESAIFNNWRDSTFFSYKKFCFDDLCALFRPAWQAQLPLLEEALKVLWSLPELKEKYTVTHTKDTLDEVVFLKENRNSAWFDYIIWKKSISMENINIKSLPLQLNLWCVKTEIWKFWAKDSWMLQNTQSLIYRIKWFISDKDNINIFNIIDEIEDWEEIPSEDTESSQDLFDKFDNFLDLANWDKLFRVDLSNIPESWDIKWILVNSIWRYFLNKSKEKTGEGKSLFEDKPVIIFIDEAHLFLNKKVKDEYSIEVELNAFDRIAKECRKFWVFLCLSTQRPRDIPEWVLSQVGTFIVHRLINDKDKASVENASPSYAKEFLNFLPSLGEWEAIVMWVNFLTTLFLKIWNPSIPPKSNTPKLFKNQGS